MWKFGSFTKWNILVQFLSRILLTVDHFNDKTVFPCIWTTKMNNLKTETFPIPTANYKEQNAIEYSSNGNQNMFQGSNQSFALHYSNTKPFAVLHGEVQARVRLFTL